MRCAGEGPTASAQVLDLGVEVEGCARLLLKAGGGDDLPGPVVDGEAVRGVEAVHQLAVLPDVLVPRLNKQDIFIYWQYFFASGF